MSGTSLQRRRAAAAGWQLMVSVPQAGWLLTWTVCVALSSPTSHGAEQAGTTWYQVSVLGVSSIGQSLGSHASVKAFGLPPISHVVPLADGTCLVTHEAPAKWQDIYVVDARTRDAVRVPSLTWGRERADAAVGHGDAFYLGTCRGISRVRCGTASWLYEFADLQEFSAPAPPPQYYSSPVSALCVDGAGNLWTRTGHCSTTSPCTGSIVFPLDEGRWTLRRGDRELSRPMPSARIWRVPCQAIAGDPVRPGLWAYGREDGPVAGLFYADAAVPAESDKAADLTPLPEVAYPLPETHAIRRLHHTRSAAPEGVTAPQLQTPLIAADITGRCWLAEGTEGAASIHVFDGQAFTNVTPPPELLRGSQLRQLVCDNSRGELLVATSGAGVLVFDGTHWSEHLLNSVLPTVKDTEMKPVDRIAVGEDGSVWLGTSGFLLHWTRDDGQQ